MVCLFLVTFYIGEVRIDGDYSSSDSTFKINVYAFNILDNQVLYNFTHSPSFAINEWIYIGVSFFRTDRIDDFYDIHIVSKTASGIESEDSFLSQNLVLSWGKINKLFESNQNLVIIFYRWVLYWVSRLLWKNEIHRYYLTIIFRID